MAFNTSIEDVHEKARLVVVRLKNVHSVCSTSKAEINNNRFDTTISIPAVIARFSAESDLLVSNGYTFSVLAPVISDIFGYGDALTLETDYDDLKAALGDLHTWIVINGAIFTHSITADGSREYNIAIEASKKTELLTKIDAVLALYI